MTFIQQLRQQPWSGHRFYQHNRVNQFLHLLSGLSFLISYMVLFVNPVLAIMLGWPLAMALRQAGYCFFDPKNADKVTPSSYEHKESAGVSYGLLRKVILINIYLASLIILLLDSSFFDLLEVAQNADGYLNNTSDIWLLLIAGAIVFRATQVFFIIGFQSGLVWAYRILSDPFYDVFIYYKSPYYLLKGEMTDGYETTLFPLKPKYWGFLE